MPRNCVCRNGGGGKTTVFNPGPNPYYTGLHRKKRTMIDRWIERGDRVHPVIDLTLEEEGEEKTTPSPKRRKRGGVAKKPATNETGLIGQPRHNPAIAEVRQQLNDLRRRAEQPQLSEKERQQLNQRIEHLHSLWLHLETQNWARNPAEDPDLTPPRLTRQLAQEEEREGGKVKIKAHRNCVCHSHGQKTQGGVLRGQPRYNPAIMEIYSVIERLEQRLLTEPPSSKLHAELRRQIDALNTHVEALKEQERHRMRGAGWEDEMKKAIERDRLAQIDKAEADRIRAAAERARSASLDKAKTKGKGVKRRTDSSPRRGWSEGGTYFR